MAAKSLAASAMALAGHTVEGGPNYHSSLLQHGPGIRSMSEQTVTQPIQCPALQQEQESVG